ncbi:hypothetical protein WJX74_001524 [Apatococcus lobatus]|uniref:tRNA (guanine(37)-N1)-methyltransferase n=1 Tax=Apatococcus lobatus TaxID=904363 RepID=A0AAW1S479_9CHLO
MKLLRGLTLDKPKLRCVVSDGTRIDTKLLLLREGLSKEDLRQQEPRIADVIKADDLEEAEHRLRIDYSYWSTEHVLKTLLPHLKEVPAAFEAVGHIAHVNLPEELRPHRFLIGQVILDKNPQLRTIVNKVGSIENEYRVFQMECIAGKPDYVTDVVQHGNRFRLNFSEVYWNSRLEHEHQRLVDTFKPGDTIVDMMAGIGPFAVPAARKRCQVYANDLNPKSFQYLCENIKLNKLGSRVVPFCMDARHFMQGLAGSAKSGNSSHEDQSGQHEDGQRSFPADSLVFQHAILNLPASAVEFLDVFNGLYDEHSWTGTLPLVHCYTFSKGAEEHAEVQQRVEAALGAQLVEPLDVHHVRDVAPNKVMLCVSFRVPQHILFKKSAERGDQQQHYKRQKCDAKVAAQ